MAFEKQLWQSFSRSQRRPREHGPAFQGQWR